MKNKDFLYSDTTDVVICEPCFTKNVNVKNVHNYELINIKELETEPICEICLISKEDV